MLFSGGAFALRAGTLMPENRQFGSGTTTHMRLLRGLIAPTRGEERWNGTEISRLADDFHRELAYVGHLNGLSGDLTPAENLEHACALAGTGSTPKEVAAALETFALERFEDTPVR